MAGQNHKFEILETITDDVINNLYEKLNICEVYWISKYDSCKVGLNCNTGGRNSPCSDETRLKIRISKIGSVVSEETKEKLRKSNGGKPSNRRGCKLSDWHISQLVKSNIGRKPKSREKIICSNGLIYDSISEAAKILNIKRQNINSVCRGERMTAGGLKFNYYYE